MLIRECGKLISSRPVDIMVHVVKRPDTPIQFFLTNSKFALEYKGI